MSSCPRDGSQLEVAHDALGPGAHGQVCVRCAGVVVEWKTAQGFFESLGLTLEELHAATKRAPAVPRTTPPPQCTSCGQASMKPIRVKGVELDLCEHCGSVWFDRGELVRVSGGRLGRSLPTAPQPVSGMREEVAGVFQMFWDCAFCGTQRLLGKSHRRCPKCGAAQDATRRYFPAPGEEVAANTEYDGADRSCPACQAPNGAKAVHCSQCGSPLDGSASVATVADRVSSPASAALSTAKKRSRAWLWAVAAGLTLLVGFCGVVVLWKKDVTAVVQGHSWARHIDIEVLSSRNDSAWCDSVPGDAYSISRRREQRSTRQIPDGETCTTRDVDRGDGTFERRRECRPKFRSEPVYDERCYYQVDRWGVARTVSREGKGLDAAPEWPVVSLGRPGSCLGCERSGARREKYVVELLGPKGERWSCEVRPERWRTLAPGAPQSIQVNLFNSPDCGSL